MPFDNQGFMFSPDGPQPEKATTAKYPPQPGPDDAPPALRGIGLVNPTTGQSSPQLDQDQVQAILGQLAQSARPPEAMAAAAPAAGPMGPPAPAAPATATPLPQILNGQDAYQRPDLGQQRNALLDRLSKGGLSASGQYYTPLSNLHAQLGEIERAQNIGIAQQKIGMDQQAIDMKKQEIAYNQSGDRRKEELLKAVNAIPGQTTEGAARTGRRYEAGLKGTEVPIADELEEKKIAATPPGQPLNQEAYFKNLWQDKGPEWMKANIKAVTKDVDLDTLKASATPGSIGWLIAKMGLPGAAVPVGEGWRRATGQPPTEADKRNIFIRKQIIGLKR